MSLVIMCMCFSVRLSHQSLRLGMSTVSLSFLGFFFVALPKPSCGKGLWLGSTYQVEVSDSCQAPRTGCNDSFTLGSEDVSPNDKVQILRSNPLTAVCVLRFRLQQQRAPDTAMLSQTDGIQRDVRLPDRSKKVGVIPSC